VPAKGGTIKVMTERVSPRIFRVVALPAPTEREVADVRPALYAVPARCRGSRDLRPQRYNRAGVERVMGFCTEDQAKRFLEVVPLFEKTIVESGSFC
jgi:polyphosphate kinase